MAEYPSPTPGYPEAMENNPIEAIDEAAHIGDPAYHNRMVGRELLRKNMKNRTGYQGESDDLLNFSRSMGRKPGQ